MNQESMGTMKIPGLIMKMAFPMIVAQLVNGLYNIVDRIYLGHIPDYGALVLTGVGICYPLIMLISAFSQLIGNGGGPRAAICLGQKNGKAADEIAANAAAALLTTAAVLMAVFFLFKDSLLFLFGASDVTFGYANEYLGTYLFGTPFVLLTLGLNPFISAQGKTNKSMITVIIGAAMNIVLDPIFIFGFGWGARGAATATVISQAASALYVIKILTSESSTIRLTHLSLKPKLLAPIVSLGISPFIMASTEAAIHFVFNTRLLLLGGDIAVGAMTIFTSVMSFVNMPIQGMNQAVSPIVSYNFGSGNNSRVKETFRVACLIMFSYTAVISLSAISFSKFIVEIFTSSRELIEYAAPYMKIYFMGYTIFGLQCAVQNTFLGLGQAGVSIFFAVFRKIILLIPLVYILSATVLGVTGVFLAESIADSVSALSAFTTFLLLYKKILSRGAPKTEV